MSVLVLAEHNSQGLRPTVRQVISAAKIWNAPIHVLLIGDDIQSIAETAAQLSDVNQVICFTAPHLTHFLAEDVAPIVAMLGREYQAIIAAHSAFSKNSLPQVAALLEVAMISEVLSIATPGRYIRPTYAGNVHATIESQDPIQVLTVRASSFPVSGSGGSATIVFKEAPLGTQKVRWLGNNCAAADRPELVSARVVVAGGHSLGSAEKFQSVLTPLASQLGGALGATRSAVDAGYAPNDIQVGQTGTIVAPELYIAVGISGAVQHTAGMRDSKIVVAINRDPEAPIFKIADYGLVADLFEAVPALTMALNESSNNAAS